MAWRSASICVIPARLTRHQLRAVFRLELGGERIKDHARAGRRESAR